MATKARQRNRKKGPVARPRASWRGMIRFGLVVFPVEAFNAHARDQAPLAFHQLHRACHSRIHYQKVCPIHGEVGNDEIVSGYEYMKGRYVELEPEELDQLRTEKERALTIDAFIAPEELDPIYLDGRMYFLSPADPEAKQPYAVLVQALESLDRWGVGEVVFSGRKQLVLVRPFEGALHMAMLNYASEIRRPTVDQSARAAATDKNVKLAEVLIDNWTDSKFDLSRYTDQYEDDLRKLIDAKVHGRDIVVPEEEEEPATYNLMEALRKSLAHKERKTQTASSNGRHPRAHRTRPRSRRRTA